MDNRPAPVMTAMSRAHEPTPFASSGRLPWARAVIAVAWGQAMGYKAASCSVECASPVELPALLRAAAHACWPSASSFDLAAPERFAGSLNAGFAQGDP